MKKKVIVVDFCFLYLYCWMRTITLSACLRHTKQRTKGKCCCYFSKLTMCVLHHATWAGDLTDCLTTTQKMCLCLLDIRSNICIPVIFGFFHLLSLVTGCMGLNIWVKGGFLFPLTLRCWIASAKNSHLHLPEFWECFFIVFLIKGNAVTAILA